MGTKNPFGEMSSIKRASQFPLARGSTPAASVKKPIIKTPKPAPALGAYKSII